MPEVTVQEKTQKDDFLLVAPDLKELKQELMLVDPAKASENADNSLHKLADDYVQRFLSVKPTDFRVRQEYKNAADQMGLQLQQESAHRSQMLKQPIAALSKRGVDGGPVANALVDLKVQVEELDPGKVDLEAGWLGRMASHIPGVGTKLNHYFSQYEAAETVIDAIMRSLKDGKGMLMRDNATLSEDQIYMRELTLKLEHAVAFAQLLDQKLSYQLERNITAEDPRHSFIAEELLFPLRQRTMDIQQQLVVNQQGVLAIELIVRNNRELIRGVDRAVNVTMSALNVAVTVALALANQKIVFNKLELVNKVTDSLIAQTAERLNTQGVEIQKQASTTMLNMDSLKASFALVNHAFEAISTFRQDSLPKMAATILELAQLTDQGEHTIQKMEQGNEVGKQFAIEVQ